MRNSNQDAFLAADTLVAESAQALQKGRRPLEPEVTLLPWAVSDGMGGHEHGEKASHHALIKLQEHASTSWNSPLAPALVKSTVASIHAELSFLGMGSSLPMGCTLTGLTFAVSKDDDCQIFVFHVGDSQLWRWRKGDLSLLTEDHNQAWGSGDGPWGRSILTSCLGGGMVDPRIDVLTLHGEPADLYLLSSDGLSETISAEIIHEEVLRSQKTGYALEDLAQRLVELAMKQGTDNVTALVLLLDKNR